MEEELETVVVENVNGEPVTINKADYDPKKHKLWTEKKKK